MKRFFLIVVVCVAATLCLVACDNNNTKQNSVDKYEISVDFTGETLVCRQTTTINNTYKEGLEELVFLLCPNAYSETAEHKAYTKKLSSYGGINVTDVSVAGQKTELALDDEAYYGTVKVPAMAIGDSIKVEFCYEVTLPECNLRLGKSDGYSNVSNFYPQLAVYGEEGFRRDVYSRVGDPVVSGVIDMSVEIKLPENTIAACPGKVAETVTDGVRTISAVCDDFRDFAFVAHENYSVKTTEVSGVVVKYYSVSDSDYSALAADVIETFSDAFGAYPYGEYVLAETAFSPDGMEYSGMAFLSKDSSDIEKTVIHETVHQWFYNIVGSDNINRPFLDEGLTTFMTEYYYELKGDSPKFSAGMKDIADASFSYERLIRLRGEKSVIDKDIYSFSEYQYTMLAYYKTAMMINNLYETAGKTKFNKAIKAYVGKNYLKRADITDLVDCFNEVLNCDVSGLVSGWLGGEVVTAKFE